MQTDPATALRAFHDAIDAEDSVTRACLDCGQQTDVSDDIMRAVVICPICEALLGDERSGVYEVVLCKEVM